MDDQLARLSRAQLREKARELQIPGLDSMSDDQLIRAIRARLTENS
ncbi:MAG TPA: Rho termination factor N-terminal domain-containing protein [Candidatus Binatia bacterium]|nr:Rho termination factor N-terminal domain-containing protein [Candidatus Binatia bacterium]